eukprot:8504212-Lingulodinium_polyedra.AAC.1
MPRPGGGVVCSAWREPGGPVESDLRTRRIVPKWALCSTGRVPEVVPKKSCIDSYSGGLDPSTPPVPQAVHSYARARKRTLETLVFSSRKRRQPIVA